MPTTLETITLKNYALQAKTLPLRYLDNSVVKSAPYDLLGTTFVVTFSTLVSDKKYGTETKTIYIPFIVHLNPMHLELDLTEGMEDIFGMYPPDDAEKFLQTIVTKIEEDKLLDLNKIVYELAERRETNLQDMLQKVEKHIEQCQKDLEKLNDLRTKNKAYLP